MPPARERKETGCRDSTGLGPRQHWAGQSASFSVRQAGNCLIRGELPRGFVFPQARPDEAGDPGGGQHITGEVRVRLQSLQGCRDRQ